jgi:hypothetical protein
MKKMFSCPPIYLSIHPSWCLLWPVSIVSSKADEFEISIFFKDLELGFGAHKGCLLACLPASVFFACALLAASLLQTPVVRLSGRRPFCLHLWCFSFARNILLLL